MIASSAPAWVVWLTLGLWGFALTVCALAVVKLRRLWRLVGPMLTPYLAALGFSAGLAQAAGQDNTDAEPERVAAFPDVCEYESHRWSDPDEPERGEHYCIRCGYIEPLPGI